MSTLYRNYRPTNFSEVFGQKHIKITLQNEISNNKLASAFLFCGPRAVGKTTLARLLAKSVNCLNRADGDYEPCSKCANCVAISLGKHLDVVEIDAASNTGVDNVRDNIISFSRLAPSQAKYKVFIIDEVHMLSVQAFNALLKIIEEPPKYVIFILATTEIHKVPYTIISRCERFDFKRISLPEVIKKLEFIAKNEKREVDPVVLDAIARRSGGHLRDAESLLGQIFSLDTKKISLADAELLLPHYNSNEVITLLSHLKNKDTISALALVNVLADAGVSMRNFISELIAMLRKIAILKISPQLSDDLGLNLGDALELKINDLCKDLTFEKILTYLSRFLLAYSDKNQLILQLPLELAVIEICTQNIGGANNLNKDSLPIKSKKFNKVPESVPENKANKDSGAALSRQVKEDVVVIENTSAIKIGKESSKLKLSCEDLMEKWPEFLIKIKKHNHSLSFVLQNCKPEDINAGTLSLVFKYKFHQDRVNDISIKALIEETLSEVYGENILIEAKLNESLQEKDENSENLDSSQNLDEVNESSVLSSSTKKDTRDSLMTNLLDAFGGEIIN